MSLFRKIAIECYSYINTFLMRLGRKLEYLGPHRYIWIKDLNIQTILDIGANKGQSIVRRRGLLGDNLLFHCFEPLNSPFSVLEKKYTQDKFIYLHNIALGDTDSKEQMHVSNIDDSSSLLTPTDIMTNTYKQIHFDSNETITIKKLDTIFSSLQKKGNILMKVDVQGFESKMFTGAEQILKEITLIVVELSFQEFYTNQPLFGDVLRQLEGYGFQYYGYFEQSADPKDGKPLQQDAIFVNKKNIR